MSPPREPDVGAGSTIDDLLDQAVAAINRGDRVAATALAEHVVVVNRRIAPTFPASANRPSTSAGLSVTVTSSHSALRRGLDRDDGA
jgi:hypothetical protein